VEGSGAVYDVSRDSRVGTVPSHFSKGYPCSRVPTVAPGPTSGEDMSHPVLKDKAGCISYMRQEDNIYNNIVYRDKCHNNQSIYYIAEDLQK
jgi:hypothetical protein